MDQSSTFLEIRNHITKAQTKKALEKFVAYLEQAPEPQAEWTDTVRQIKARYFRTENDKKKGVISFDNAQLSYNRVNDELLGAVDAIEEGRPVPKTVVEQKSKTPVWLLMAGTALVVLAVAFFINKARQHKVEPTVQEIEELPSTDKLGRCPAFPSESVFNIILLPFKPLGSDKTDVDSGLRDRLAGELEKYEIPAYVLTRGIDVSDSNIYPSSFSDAEKIGRPCQAKLIIWGTSEKLTTGETITTTKFRFLDIEEFSQTALFLDSNAEVDTISSLSSIAAEGALTQTLEQSIKILFGLVAHQSGQHDIAATLIEEVAKDLDEPLGPNWGMVLADSYTNMADYEQAIRVYDAILAEKPEHQAAREKRGFLLYQAGEYEKAAEDLSMVVEENPENTTVRTARAAAYIRSNQLDAARTDIEIVEKVGDRPAATTHLKTEYQQYFQVEERRKAAADQRLDVNPNDPSALQMQAQAAQNLGQYNEAGLAAAKLLAIDPKNEFAITTLRQLRPKIRDTVAFNNMILQLNPAILKQIELQNFEH